MISIFAQLLPVADVATRLPRPSDGDLDYGWKLLVGTTVTFGFASVAVGLRIVARLRYARMGWDGSLMLFALVFSLHIATRKDCLHRL